jgi:hypothetical protein
MMPAATQNRLDASHSQVSCQYLPSASTTSRAVMPVRFTPMEWQSNVARSASVRPLTTMSGRPPTRSQGRSG